MTTRRDWAKRIAEVLIERGQTLAVAEASAGGRVSAALTAVPGSSRWFLGCAVVYAAVAKQTLLGITAEDLASSGAVDPTAALLLARAVRARLGATWGAAETGVAGPQIGRRSRKPAGLAYLAVVGPDGEWSREVRTGRDDREGNQDDFALATLALLGERLQQE